MVNGKREKIKKAEYEKRHQYMEIEKTTKNLKTTVYKKTKQIRHILENESKKGYGKTITKMTTIWNRR